MKKILSLFLCLVPAIYLCGCSDSGKEKPNGDDPSNDVCKTKNITACTSGDGCCPTGCSAADDSDCKAEASGAKIGNPCTGDAECGVGGKCVVEQSDGVFKGGYCVVACTEAKACPKDSKCVADYFGNSAKESLCVKDCVSNSDCRNGYLCDDTNKTCLPQRSTCDPAADNCPLGTTCLDTDGNGIYECKPTPGLFGTECSKDADCTFMAGAECLKLNSSNQKGFCSFSCIEFGKPTCTTLNGVCRYLANDNTKAYCFEECDPTSSSTTCSHDQFECIKVKDVPKGGLCAYDVAPKAPIGNRCTENSQCGPQGFCIKQSGSKYKGGICTSRCSRNGKCPTGSSCGGTYFYTGRTFDICLPDCTDASSCRSGYTCTSKKVCDTLPAQTCTKGASPSGCPAGEVCGDSDLDGTYTCYPKTEVGKPCTQNADCASNLCYIYSRLGKGLCSLECDLKDLCPEGTWCARFGEGSSAYFRCLNPCNDTADCRQQGNENPPGFSCYAFGPGNVCWNILDVTVGDACTTADDCKEKGFDAICEGFGAGKFCTADCTDGKRCPNGTVCHQSGANAYCVQECSKTGACPTGTTCQPGNICY